MIADWVGHATPRIHRACRFPDWRPAHPGFSVLTGGTADVVRAQLAATIIGTSRLGLRPASVVREIGRRGQRFTRERDELLLGLAFFYRA